MAKPPPTRLHIDPPMDHWQVAPRNGRAKPIIATGHQPTLWHPGILAKYLAADAFAAHVGGSALNVSVEHNPVGPLFVDVPAVHGERLSVRRVLLDQRGAAAALPPNRLGPIGVDRELDVPGPIAKAFAKANDLPNQAAQVTEVLARLMRPYLHSPMPTLTTSALVTQSFVDRLLQDPVGCTRGYNRAALAYPQARIRPLYIGRDVVEAPLWAQGKGACTPVFVDLGDSQKPLLFTQGQALDLASEGGLDALRPRAVTLSAIMRSEHCDLFIHGTGGGVYDQVTDRWWRGWTGEDLAPNAVVSADVTMAFDVPLAGVDELTRAQWFAHHLPHNVDRFAELDRDDERVLVDEKRHLLDRMDDDRNKRRRAAAFKRIHGINAELARGHQAALDQARQQVTRAGVGLANARIAARRDWCFACYGQAQLRSLAQQVGRALVQ